MKKKILTLCLVGVALNSYTYGQEKVGIYTDDPQASLDVNGRTKIMDVPDLSGNGTQLYLNTTTGRVEEVGDTKPFHIVKFVIRTNDNGDKLNVKDFDTKISKDKYTVSIASVYPKVDDATNGPKVSHVYTTDGEQWAKDFRTYVKEGNKQYAVHDIDADRINPIRKFITREDASTNTWHLSITHPGAKAKDVVIWEIKLLVANKTYANSAEFFGELTDGASGALTENPIK